MTISVRTVPIREVMGDAALKDSLTACHVAVYNERGDHEWCQAWTREEAEIDLYVLGEAVHDTTYVTLIQDGEKVVGFSVIAIGRTSQVVTPEEMPPGLKLQEHADGVRRGIEAMTGTSDPVTVYYRHFGIIKAARSGSAMPAKLIIGVEPEATRLGAEWSGGWTLVRSILFAVLKTKGFKIVYTFPGGDKAYMGCLPTREMWEKFARIRRNQPEPPV